MKKVFTLLTLVLIMVIGTQARAGVVTDRASAGTPMTYSEFLALSGTGKHFALVGASSNTQFCYPNWFGFQATYVGTISPAYLFDLEASTTGEGWYNIKRVSDNLYVSAEGGQFNASTKLDFKPVNRRAGDYAEGFEDENLHISLDNAAGNHYNLNTSNLGFRSGTGGYSTVIAYGPFYLVTVNCLDESNNTLQEPVTYVVTDGTTVEAPSIVGKEATGTTSITVNGADAVLNVVYTEATSYDYTLVVNNAPAGASITIKGDDVTNQTSYSSTSAVAVSDVVVTPPNANWQSTVTISGSTITVSFQQVFNVTIPDGFMISVGNKVSSVTPVTSGDDNSHWYMVTQVRGGESVAYAGNNGERLRRGTTSQTAASFNGKAANANGAYFLRFISTGEPDLYKIQFGDGRFVDSALKPSATTLANAATYAFYNSNGGNGSYFGWNLSNKSGNRVDNNAAGNDLAFWGAGEVSGSSGNNIWYVYELTLTDPNAFVNVTYNVVDGEKVIGTSVVQQEKNSTVTIPVELLANTTIYDYTASGTIGESDCIITVVRTMKEGVVTDAAQISNNKLYTFTPYDASRGLLSASSSEAALNTKGANTKFALFAYEGKTYLYNFDAGKFVNDQNNISGINGYYFTLVDTPDAFVAVAPAEYEHTFTLKMNNAHCINASNGWAYGAVGNWNDLDPGNQFHIIAVEDMTPEQNAALQTLLDEYFHPSYTVTYVVKDTDDNTLFTSEAQGTTLGANITTLPAEMQNTLFYDYNTIDLTVTDIATTATFTATLKENAPFRFTADTTAPIWNKLTLKGSNYPTYVADGTPNVITPTTDANDETTQWAFVGNPYAGFYLYNRAAGTDLVLGSPTAAGDGADGGNTYATLAAKGTQTNELWFPSASTNITNGFYLFNPEGHALNERSASNLAYWTGGNDKGSTFNTTEILEGETLFNALIAQLEAVPFGTTVNTFTLTGDYAAYASNPSVLVNALKTAGFSTETLARVQDVLANVVINLPAAGFYRIKGQTSGKYLASGMASNKKFAMTDATDASTIFYFNGTTLVNYETTKANGMNASAWAWVNGETASNVAFHDGLTNGGYAIQSATAYFYDNGDNSSSADRGGNLVINASTNARYTSWYLEPVSELKVSLTNLDYWHVEGNYTTLYMPVAVKISDEATAYAIVKNADGVTLDMVACPDNVVPANTGVILNGNYAQCTATLSTEAGTATSVLTGTTPMISAVDGCYVLSVANEKLGFYKFAGTELKGFHAYYVDETADPTRGFVLNMGDPTGINPSLLTGDASQVYDLQGRRVVNAQKGLYIINGKKVVK
ncbi:MAG: hypothetical protein SPL50_03725 [Alloprevotella sp.]|nr:hypothetical protein [Alloprevotella sp.]